MSAEVFDQEQHRVIAWDPSGEWPEGGIVTGHQARQLGERGVVTLPVDVDALRVGGGGYARRGWGGGFPVDSTVPRPNAPIQIWLQPEHRRLSWAARLTADDATLDAYEAGDWREGFLKLAADTGHPTSLSAQPTGGEAPAQMRSLGRPGYVAAGLGVPGWVVLGTARISPAREGAHGFCLYGHAPGIRVAWLACAASR